MDRAERRRRERNKRRRPREEPTFSQNLGGCRFPRFFATEACCICGSHNAQTCPCDNIEALAHLERVHQDVDSNIMREAMGCLLEDSTPAPTGEAVGNFVAPCEDGIMYMTTLRLPTMAHYRWHAIYDHVQQGSCADPETCQAALGSGDV